MLPVFVPGPLNIDHCSIERAAKKRTAPATDRASVPGPDIYGAGKLIVKG
jgi:hypothetical protein